MIVTTRLLKEEKISRECQKKFLDLIVQQASTSWQNTNTSKNICSDLTMTMSISANKHIIYGVQKDKRESQNRNSILMIRLFSPKENDNQVHNLSHNC